jgi:hypothetical protein
MRGGALLGGALRGAARSPRGAGLSPRGAEGALAPVAGGTNFFGAEVLPLDAATRARVVAGLDLALAVVSDAGLGGSLSVDFLAGASMIILVKRARVIACATGAF